MNRQRLVQYIDAVCSNRRHRVRADSHIYSKTAEFVRLYSESFAPGLEVVFVYSTSRLCQLVRGEGRSYLIYDQYIGKTLARMNEIVLADNLPKKNAQALFLCIIVEYLLSTKRFTEALRAAHLFYLCCDDPDLVAPGKVGKESYWQRAASLQESFLMFHEVAHLLLDSRLDRFSEAIDGMYSEAERCLRQVVKNLEQSLCSTNADVFASSLGASEPLPLELISMIKEDLQSGLLTYQRSALGRGYLIEEVVCDTYALWASGPSSRPSPANYRVAADHFLWTILCLLNLKTIELVLDAAEKNILGRQGERFRRATEFQARVDAIELQARDYLRKLALDIYVEELEDEMASLKWQHHDRLAAGLLWLDETLEDITAGRVPSPYGMEMFSSEREVSDHIERIIRFDI